MEPMRNVEISDKYLIGLSYSGIEDSLFIV